MHATIRRYAGNAQLADQLAERADDIKNVIMSIPGVVGYYLVRAGGDTISITVSENEEGGRRSNEEAANWLRANMPDALPSPPEVYAGDVLLSL